jgi:hypothetical protein
MYWRGRKIPDYQKMLDRQDTPETSEILAEAYDRAEQMEPPYIDEKSMSFLPDIFNTHVNVCIERILKEREAEKAWRYGSRLTTLEEHERCHRLLLDGSLVEFQEFLCTLNRVTYTSTPTGRRKTQNIIDFMETGS